MPLMPHTSSDVTFSCTAKCCGCQYLNGTKWSVTYVNRSCLELQIPVCFAITLTKLQSGFVRTQECQQFPLLFNIRPEGNREQKGNGNPHVFLQSLTLTLIGSTTSKWIRWLELYLNNVTFKPDYLYPYPVSSDVKGQSQKVRWALPGATIEALISCSRALQLCCVLWFVLTTLSLICPLSSN